MIEAQAIEKLIDERIRPSLALDGGNIDLVKVEDDTVYVKLLGACGTCPASQMTLKFGVERILRESFPELKELVAVR